MFTTNYPGLRKFFLQYKNLGNLGGAQDLKTAIERLWKRKINKGNPLRKKWTFFYEFAMDCILSTVFAPPVEDCPIDELGIVWKEGSYGILDDLLRTWVTCDFDEIRGLVAMRYLGGILRLPGFWRKENRNHHHQIFAKKLFKRIRTFLEDVGIGWEGLLVSPEHVSDIEGIDMVTHSALEGVFMWSKYCTEETGSECWFVEFRKVINLLLNPEAINHLPQSSRLAIRVFSEVGRKSFLGDEPRSESTSGHQQEGTSKSKESEVPASIEPKQTAIAVSNTAEMVTENPNMEETEEPKELEVAAPIALEETVNETPSMEATSSDNITSAMQESPGVAALNRVLDETTNRDKGVPDFRKNNWDFVGESGSKDYYVRKKKRPFTRANVDRYQ
ncbi:hypothetical protein FRC17_003851 [Serendipita sp. 399]|nr:hypothetical protein FRC17_003851 [Serendipita sp. 399]